MEILLCFLLFINALAFSLMGLDKARAKRGVRRIPEKTLFLSAVLGGSAGAIAGMYVFRHKTRHRHFVVGMPLILLLQLAAAFWLLRGSPAPL